MKNFHMDLIRVTETGAISAAEWVGRGNKEAADKAATEAMRERLNEIEFYAEVAIGEGKKDNSFGLFEGDEVGMYRDCTHDTGPLYELAVDPIEGTTPTAKGGYEAMSVIAMATNGSFFKTDAFYMKKLAVGRHVTKKNPFNPDIRRSLEENVVWVAGALNKEVQHVTVCLLDRPRHEEDVYKLRRLGCRIMFIADCDVTACIASCVKGGGVDMYYGVGGAPEAVIAAAAMKCMRGKLQCQIADAQGKVLDDRVYEINDLAAGDVMFCATGITDGKLLKGVKFTEDGPITHSIAMRSQSGTIRREITEHGN